MRSRKRAALGPVAVLAWLALAAAAQAQSANPFDHVHLAVPEVERARDWYIDLMGGNVGETPDSVAWGAWPGDHPLPFQLLFRLSADPKPSADSAIGHIGFSFADLPAKVETLRAAGVEIVSPVTDVPGLWKQAVAKDPWGTTLLLVEDRDTPGIHHVELRMPDPAAALDWYARAFGGERVKYKGVRDAIRYRELGDFYLFAVKVEGAAATDGHVIDHLGFGPIDLDKTVAALTAQGATFVSNPNPRINPGCRLVFSGDGSEASGVRRLYCAPPDQLAHRVVFLEGPGGAAIELVQHLEAGGH